MSSWSVFAFFPTHLVHLSLLCDSLCLVLVFVCLHGLSLFSFRNPSRPSCSAILCVCLLVFVCHLGLSFYPSSFKSSLPYFLWLCLSVTSVCMSSYIIHNPSRRLLDRPPSHLLPLHLGHVRLSVCLSSWFIVFASGLYLRSKPSLPSLTDSSIATRLSVCLSFWSTVFGYGLCFRPKPSLPSLTVNCIYPSVCLSSCFVSALLFSKPSFAEVVYVCLRVLLIFLPVLLVCLPALLVCLPVLLICLPVLSCWSVYLPCWSVCLSCPAGLSTCHVGLSACPVGLSTCPVGLSVYLSCWSVCMSCWSVFCVFLPLKQSISSIRVL